MRRSVLVLSAAALFVVAADASSSANTRAAVVALAANAPAGSVSILPPSPPLPPSTSPRVDALAVAGAVTVPTPATVAVLAGAKAAEARSERTERTETAPTPAVVPAAVAAAPAAKLVSGSRDACVMSVPVSGDPASFLATATKVLGAKGGSVSGTTRAGSFSVPAPLGDVDGTYALEGAAARITIAPASLGFVQSCSKVYGALTTALAR